MKFTIMKSTKILILVLSLFCSHLATYATDCRSFTLGEARKVNYEISDVIFSGIATNIEKSNGEFIVFEQYKGNIPKNIIVKFLGYVREEDIFSLWVIYGNKSLNNDTIYVDECSISRCLDNPFSKATAQYAPPPLLLKDGIQEDGIFLTVNDSQKQIYISKWRDDFFDEIEILRGLSAFNSATNTNDQTETSGKMLKWQKFVNYAILIIAITVILLLFLFTRIKKTQNN